MIRLLIYGAALAAWTFISTNPFQSSIIMVLIFILAEIIVINDKMDKK